MQNDPLFDEQQDESAAENLRFEDYISLTLFWALALILFAQFFTRYVLNVPLGWSEEVARYLLILLAFAGSCIASRNNSHIGVTILHRYLSPKVKAIFQLAISMLSFAIVIALAVYAWQIVFLIEKHTLASLTVSLSWVYGLILLCLVLMAWRTLIVIRQDYAALKTTQGEG
ncbi:C4-dicarboxylate ABC transporter permease [Saccharobesus litoralis]|uniref:TRAP transporter small permease protein n=1 Tax=Saccharobesus litoralis TaxID=2172099 RepID=A0A2S0VNP4_9ALTE|nr:TRAP transporter small permease [Saccharobesus litoralis]AWB65851.1 C4-dicarboxylate ABC transporter permease [Saccharobesus litoralis]